MENLNKFKMSDLEKAAFKEAAYVPYPANGNHIDSKRYDSFIAGALWQKEQMMKGFCFETKVYRDDDGTIEDGNYEEWLDLENKEIIDLPIDKLGLKDGDIVQVIIIKK